MTRHRDRSKGFIGAVIAVAVLLGPVASAQTPTPVSFHFGGFADATVSHATDTHRDHFDFGEVDLYATAQLSDRWGALGEALVQGRTSDNELDASTTHSEVALERLYVSYTRSDSLRLEVGRVYTGIVDWNEREHRGRFLQTSIDVPSIARRQEQGGAWPLHFLGGWASGNVPGTSGLQYGAGIGAGRGTSLDDVGLLTRRGGSPAGLLSFSIAPNRLQGFRVGASAFVDTIPAAEGRYREVDRTVSMTYTRGGVEFRSEWSRMNHRLRSSGTTYVTEGWYTLLSVRLPGPLTTLRPYLLVDHLNVAAGEPYLASVDGHHSWAAGTRWDVAKNLAVKIDFRRQSRSEPSSRGAIRLQAAISF